MLGYLADEDVLCNSSRRPADVVEMAERQLRGRAFLIKPSGATRAGSRHMRRMTSPMTLCRTQQQGSSTA